MNEMIFCRGRFTGRFLATLQQRNRIDVHGRLGVGLQQAGVTHRRQQFLKRGRGSRFGCHQFDLVPVEVGDPGDRAGCGASQLDGQPKVAVESLEVLCQGVGSLLACGVVFVSHHNTHHTRPGRQPHLAA